MQRMLFFAYGLLAHVLFLGIYLWMAVFTGSLGGPLTVDAPGAVFSAPALAWNAAWIALFGVQHTVMARPGFKRVWTRWVPTEIERSTYVMASNAAFLALMVAWRPVGPVVWHVEGELARGLLWSLFALGWVGVPAVSFFIDHFDLFGTRQVWLHLRGQPYRDHPFATPGPYRYVRHPLYVGWILAFWATPTMSAGHLLLALGLTAYIGIAIVYEERDLVAHFGERYERYRKQVPALLPWPARSAPQREPRTEPAAFAAAPIETRDRRGAR